MNKLRKTCAVGVCLSFCSLLFSVTPSIAQSARPNLSDVVRTALETNPDVTEARDQWLATREQIREAEGGYLPTVDLNAGMGYEYTDSPSTRAARGDSNELMRKELGISVRQMLFDGWGTRSEVTRQQARTDSASARLMSAGESTAMNATQAYVDLQRNRAIREITQQSLTIHKRIQDQIRLRSEAGVGRRADLEQVMSRVALAEVNLVAADVNLRDASTTFEKVVGVPPAPAYEPAELFDDEVPATLDAVLDGAMGNNPLLDVAAADIDAARAQHEAAKQFDYPRFDLELGGNLDDNLSGVDGRVDTMSAMLRMRYNLYRGGSDSARKRSTAHNISEAMDVRDRTVRQLQESIRLAWAAWQATSQQLPLQERQVDAAKATRDAYQKQFNIGERTLLDLLNSENEVLQARQSVVDTKADNLLAQFRLLEAMGLLVDKLDAAEALAHHQSISGTQR